MNIVVCVKHVPDAQSERTFNEDTTTDREGVDGLLSELDEYPVEAALKLKEDATTTGTEGAVTVLTVGPEQAADALKKALQMGADQGVHVLDDAIHGSDAVATSLV
ncbi:MAG TPA: electron transfer flavoprotein subunit beta, partial [Segeticoccus sp.]|nr:electron transfer flavoprotein subunit beta [Segeticoccus sp.]